MDNLVQMEWANAAGLWVGFIFTLLIFSALLGDHLLARLAQYVLVGAVLGYAVVVTWQSILASDVATSLRTAPQEKPWNWIPVLLAVVMTIAGLERIFAQGRAPSRQSAAWGRGLRALGAIPALALVSIGAAVTLVGAVQGTLAPQFLSAARSDLTWGAEGPGPITGILVLVLTVTALLFFVIDADRHLEQQPIWVQRPMRVLLWFGQRALWLAAGAIFARLLASRLSLLAAELAHWSYTLQSTTLGQMLERWWRIVIGA
ncbi:MULTISPECIES: hypothetical protein [Caldilinea]|jgi:hypothetical protein|uniref:hypothetical protein n=1 Tax=Caldilinea TaxID=233191 RepID=UPI0005C4E47B|nr:MULTISPECIES: hypothetical protein [Caldilinea]GIV74858.1 MAG: hypothetical protein KatS3mg049_3414 [Caldilinea sp.]